MKNTDKVNEENYLVVLPGWSTDSEVFNNISNDLSKYFKLIYLDWSDVKQVSSFREKIEREVFKNKIKIFSILGWSLGAVVGLEFAMFNKNIVDKLILISPTSRFTTDKKTGYSFGVSTKVVRRMKQNLVDKPRQTLIDFYNSMYCDNEQECSHNIQKFKLLKKEFITKNEVDALSVGLDYLTYMDLRNSLKDIQTKALLIHGQDDSICPPSASEYILSENQEYFTLKLIDNCGHIPFVTRSKECLEYIGEFIYESENKNDR